MMRKIVNPGPDSILDSAGSIWEAREIRTVDTSDPVVGPLLSIDRLVDLGAPDQSDPDVAPEITTPTVAPSRKDAS